MPFLAFRQSALPTTLGVLARVRHAYGPLALDLDHRSATHTDADGTGWVLVSLRDDEATPALVARHGALAANRAALDTYVAGLTEAERYPVLPPTMTLDVAAIRERVDAMVGPMEVRNDGPDGEPFEDRTDLADVLAEQGPQTALVYFDALPPDLSDA